MFKLLFAKSFADLWENFFPSVLLNILHLGLAVGFFFVNQRLPEGNYLLLSFVLLFAAFFVSYFFAFAYLKTVKKADDLRWYRFLWPALFTALAQTTVIAAGSVAIQYYFQGNFNPLWFLGAIASWMLLFWMAGSQMTLGAFFSSGEAKPFKSLKLSFRVALTSPGNTLLVWILGSLIGLTAAILIPGPAYGFLLSANLQTFLERKRQWLESASEEELDGKVPWNKILSDYLEAAKKKTFRSMIFPWK